MIKVGIIGEGQTFGDTDASRGRNYLYTLRTHSMHSSVYSINTTEFMNHLASCSKLYELKMYQYIQDNKLVNQLALTLRNYIEGINMENRNLETHESADEAPHPKSSSKPSEPSEQGGTAASAKRGASVGVIGVKKVLTKQGNE